MKLKVKVTYEHIRNGVVEDESYCPVALAIQESSGDSMAAVSLDYITIGYGEYGCPDGVAEKVSKYDTLGEMEPFEFDMEIDSRDFWKQNE